MNQITDNIWLGSKEDAANHDKLRKEGITAILNCSLNLPPQASRDHGFLCAHCGMNDSGDNNLLSWYSAVLQLANLIKQGHKVLVHCRAGISRSPFVVLCYLRATNFHETLVMNLIPYQYEPVIPLDMTGQRILKYLQMKRDWVDPRNDVLDFYKSIDFEVLKKLIDATPEKSFESDIL